LSEIVSFEDVGKSFWKDGRPIPVLENIRLGVERGSFTTFIGPSGCGKTTLLRLLAGLTPPTSGRVLYKSRPVSAVNREIGFVTQDSNLFPWLTLVDNVEFPLLVRGVQRQDRRDRALAWIRRVGLEGFENHYPHELSGGMQKRASIVRALIYSPDIVLMDEPFGPLDAQTRMVLQHELMTLWYESQMTILFITHDLTESIALSDQVVLMTRGPARIKGVFRIDLPRPRNVFEIHEAPGFKEIYHAIWSHFRPDVLRVKETL
jgi:NitT/TauT family transport system ATP-binding protein